MTTTSTDTGATAARPDRRTARDRIEGPVATELRAAGILAVVAGLAWPVQAALASWAIAGWVSGSGTFSATLAAAAGFAAAGLVRAGLDHRAGAILFDAADRVVARERASIVIREARAPGPAGSAAVGALLSQKLPMLVPWITRYRVAIMRVSVLPALYLAIAFTQSWAAGLVLLAAGPLIPVFMALVGMAAESASRRQLAEIGTMNDMLMERLAAMLDIRLLGARERAAADFAERAESLRARTMAVLRIAFLSSAVLELFAAIGVAMLAVYVGFSLLGELKFGTWGAPLALGPGLFLLMIAPEYFQTLRDLAAAWHDRAAGLAVAAELAELDDAPRTAMLGTGAGAEPLSGPCTVQLRGAVAALPGHPLRLPDLDVAPGEAVALTGPSGAGKTTVLAVVAGLVPLAEGRAEVCGFVLDDTTADAWRARLAVLPQRLHFADEPLGAFLDPSCRGDVVGALTQAHADEVVRRLPEGLATRLGESGGGVSGGEARRLAMARAISRGGDLLIADEPTADLDAETAAKVIDSLIALKAAGVGMLVATHDPSLIAALDRVVEVGIA